MPRTRIASPQQIKTLNDANQALKEIGALQIQLEVIDGEASKEIGLIKERAAKDGEKARAKIKNLEQALALFGEYNKADLFSEKKTVELSYGSIGFRLSTKVKTKKNTLELLKKLFPGKAIRIEEKINKEELKDWEDKDLAKVDAAKVTEDTFGYEVNKEEVNKNLLKAG